MTRTYSIPSTGVRTVKTAANALRARGLRVSAARRLVLQALYEAEGPVTAEAIAAGLDGRLPLSDLGSVYRNLDMLEQAGLVSHVHLGHGPGLYALAGAGQREFVVCERCGAFRALDDGELDDARAAILARTGFETRFAHFPAVGVCPDCRAASSQSLSE